MQYTKYFDKNGYDCLDEALCTIFQKRNIEYSVAFLESWGFEFERGKETIGKAFTSSRGDRFALLNDLYNIEFSAIKLNNQYDLFSLEDYFEKCTTIETVSNKILTRIKFERKMNREIILHFDSFYCEWDELYQKYHGIHACIIDQVDDDGVNIIDPWYNKTIKISFELFNKIAFNIIIINFDSYQTNLNSINMLMERFINHYNKNDIKESLSYFYNRLKKIDFDIEFKGCNKQEYTKALINRHLKELSNTRRQASNLMTYFYLKFEVPFFNDISVLFTELSNSWWYLRENITKAYLSGIWEEQSNFVLIDKIIKLELQILESVKAYKQDTRIIKCIAWDLDNTVWEGTLDNNDSVQLKGGIIEIFKYLKMKGIPSIIVSKNNYDFAFEKIVEFGLEQFFVDIKISWENKYKAIEATAKRLNIGLDTILFVDDSDLELIECKSYLPEIMVLNASKYKEIPSLLNNVSPDTLESSTRIEIYQQLEKRKKYKEKMTNEEFLDFCKVQIDIMEATDKDLDRVIELSNRTNQFNLSGNKLNKEILLKTDLIYVCRLKDIFADYGIVGTIVCNIEKDCMDVLLFAASCKVEGRNIGKSMIEFLIKTAKDKKINEINARFFDNRKNMRLTALFLLYNFQLNEEKDKLAYLFDKKENTIAFEQNELSEETVLLIKEIVSNLLNEELEIKESLYKRLSSLQFMNLIIVLEKEFNIIINFNEIDISWFKNIYNIALYIDKSKRMVNIN